MIAPARVTWSPVESLDVEIEFALVDAPDPEINKTPTTLERPGARPEPKKEIRTHEP